MARDTFTPFQRSWIKPKVDFSKYRKIHIAPTNIEYTKVKGTFLNERRLFTRSYQDDVQKNAQSLSQSFEKAFSESKPRSWEVVSTQTRAPGTLIVEPALVEIAPSRPIIEAAGYLYPGTFLINRPTVALEARIKDARTGEVLATLADRESPPFAPIDLAKLRFYKAQQNIMRRWGRQTARWINQTNSAPIWDPLPIRLITW